MSQNDDLSITTRATLLERLRDLEDQAHWQQFFDTYAPLIRRVALKGGLTDAEADEVVQETVISVARHLPGFRYDPKVCSFKTWMLRLTRWRIIDQVRKRVPGAQPIDLQDDDATAVAVLNQLTLGRAPELQALWENEWQKTVLGSATERVKRRVSPETFQMFELYGVHRMPVREVARFLDVTVARIYLAKHRVQALLKQEIAAIEREGG